MTRTTKKPAWLVSLVAVGSVFLAASGHAESGPPLWKISDDNNTVYLFGTFHLLPEDADWQSEAVIAAMQDATITVTEADTLSPEAMQGMQALVVQYGLNPPGTTLSQVLGPDRAASLFEIAGAYGVPSGMLEPLKPWLALLSVTQAAYVANGLNPELGVEKILNDMAVEQGDSIEFLETVERQIKALAALDGEIANDFVDVSLDEFDELQSQLKVGLDAWLSGDTAALDESMIAAVRDESPMAFDLIFVQRNREWIERITAYLDGDADTFIAVGTGHLVGDDSVIDMLEDAGIEVARIQ
ncbi:MAG: TraB/GumN family protein [Pseudomonadota bacterium]